MGINSKNFDIFGVTVCYRGWKIRPFIRTSLVRLGPTKMLCLGPVAIMWG